MSLSSLYNQIEALEHSISTIEEKLEEFHPPVRISNYFRNSKEVKVSFVAGQKLGGHSDKVHSVCWAQGPSNSIFEYLFASTCADSSVILWNSKTGTPVCKWVIKENATLVSSAFEKCSGELLATSSFEGSVYIFKIGFHKKKPDIKQKPIFTFKAHESYVSCLSFLGATHLLTGSGDNSVKLYGLPESQEPLKVFGEHTEDVMTLDTSSSSPYLFLSGSCDSSVKLWDIRSGSSVTTFKSHKGDVNAVKFLEGSQNSFVSAGSDGCCLLQDLRALRPLGMYEAPASITSLDLSYSGRVLVTGDSEGDMRVWDLMNEQQSLQVLPAHGLCVTSVSLGRECLATSGYDGFVNLWSVVRSL